MKEWAAIFGYPVVPEVKNISIGSSLSGASSGAGRGNSPGKAPYSASKGRQPGRSPLTQIFSSTVGLSAMARSTSSATVPSQVQTMAFTRAALKR